MRKVKCMIMGGVLAAVVALGALVAAPMSALAVGSARAMSSGDTCTIYRLYNPYTGEHFYTASADERDTLIPVGWQYEGVGWTATDNRDDVIPVYRLYNRYVPGEDHHYTTDKNEYNELKKFGCIQEGATWYVPSEEWPEGRPSTPVYRLYNPNAVSGAHHYTTDAEERDALVKAGWKDEGTGWNAINGRQLLLDENAPSYLFAVADALKVPNDQYITYKINISESEYVDEVDGRTTVAFYGDDNDEYGWAYLNDDNTVDLSIFHLTFGPNVI